MSECWASYALAEIDCFLLIHEVGNSLSLGDKSDAALPKVTNGTEEGSFISSILWIESELSRPLVICIRSQVEDKIFVKPLYITSFNPHNSVYRYHHSYVT